ncbi:hypothetical protein JIN85_16225 [Luteolibacter pohnpeiensis]|uniref:Organic solvent tolerance-like N-terminal domain-containing protein n=1 Tax=Luteolibacter pohnpeiensis TaxID=454153 RepID=A0A934S875_9BACT|nr:hypothetical protein [Luteolibacter pohnpeiensis]
MAQDVVLDQDQEPESSKPLIPAASLLPPGSVLKGVMLPRYDEEMRLTSVLRSEVMTLIDAYQIEGQGVVIRFFNPDHTQRAQIDLQRAIFDQRSYMLHAEEPVKLVGERFSVEGLGLVYAIDQSKGFVMGPVKSVIEHPKSTAMNSSSIPKFGISALLGASLVPMFAATPPPVSAEEKAAVQADAAPMSELVREANRQTRTDLRSDLAQSNAANAAVEAFLAKADLLDQSTDGSTVYQAEAAPLDMPTGSLRTVIDCDGGVYFDSKEGILVFLKNVRVTDPRFTLSGANELKVFFKKKTDTSQKEQDKVEVAVGDVDRIVATGSVLMERVMPEGEPPMKASGALFSYSVANEKALLTGGKPWIIDGDKVLRAKQAEATLNVDLKSGVYSFDGRADASLNATEIKH